MTNRKCLSINIIPYLQFTFLEENSAEVARVRRDMEKRLQNLPASVNLQPLLPPTTVIHHDRGGSQRFVAFD